MMFLFLIGIMFLLLKRRKRWKKWRKWRPPNAW